MWNRLDSRMAMPAATLNGAGSKSLSAKAKAGTPT
jgi:hypothetical protein